MIKLKQLVKEIFDEIDVPPVLYHATFNQLAIKIEKEGIIPGGNDIQNFSGIKKGVYLASDPEFAGSMVVCSENDNVPEEWYDEIVIISINTSKLNLSKLDRDPNIEPQEDEYDDNIPADQTIYSFIYEGFIPPDAIIGIVDYK